MFYRCLHYHGGRSHPRCSGNRTSNEHSSITWHGRLRSSDLGSIGHLASVATVAASSFEMKLVDPSDLIASIDLSQWERLRTTRIHLNTTNSKSDLAYVEPCGSRGYPSATTQTQKHIENMRLDKDGERQVKSLQGKVQKLGDFIDTDAVSVYSFIRFVKCQS